jgi:hypothetical protein
MMSGHVIPIPNTLRDPFVDAFGRGRGPIPQAFVTSDATGELDRRYYLGNDPVAAVLHRPGAPAWLRSTAEELVEESYYQQGQLHRADGPARITTRPDGVRTEEYFTGGLCHRQDGPARVVTDAAGVLSAESYFCQGQQHREDGPAVVKTEADGSREERWYRDGKLHREDGPAHLQVQADGSRRERWYRHGQLHRELGPADVTFAADGTSSERHFLYGQPRNKVLTPLSPLTGNMEYYDSDDIKGKQWNYDKYRDDYYSHSKYDGRKRCYSCGERQMSAEHDHRWLRHLQIKDGYENAIDKVVLYENLERCSNQLIVERDKDREPHLLKHIQRHKSADTEFYALKS